MKRIVALLLVLVLCFGCIGVLPVAAANPEQNSGEATSLPTPILYLDMEDITNNQVQNKTGSQEFHVGGTATLDTSVNGTKALRFDGTTYIELGTDVPQLTNAYTMTGWFWQEAGATDGQALFARGNSGKVMDQLAVLVKDSKLYHCVSVGTGNTQFSEGFSSPQAVPEQWNHFAVTRDGNQVRLYINGQLAGTITTSGDNFVQAQLPMYIGMDCNGNGELYNKHAFKGLMDEMRIYDAALTEEQIQAMYQSVTPYQIARAENGALELQLLREPETTLAQTDFTIEFQEDGKKISPKITDYQYNADSQKAVFTFEPLKNFNNQVKTVSVTTVYAGFTLHGQFTIPASDNQAPSAEQVEIVNPSTKLGDDPHVKGMLKVQYQYSDPDLDAEGETKYQWLIADTRDGEYTELQGINTSTIILLDKYEGKYLKCRVTPRDCYSNIGESALSTPTSEPVAHTEGNPLTDWLYEGGYGLSHHFLANYFNASDVYREEREKWDIESVSWNDFVSQFDAEKYAEQVAAVGAKYVTLTMGQNNGYYLAPSETYDKYLREAGLLGENETNPKTAEYDLPMKLADALAKYDIKLMLYLPANPPHSAHWNTEGSSGYGFIGNDYKITTEVFDYTPGSDGVPSQRARKVVTEMVREWSERYGDKISGWWFDGVFSGGYGLLEGWTDMSLEYNIASLANAAKAGNPYSIVTFNPGLGGARFSKTNDYQDYTSGENGALTPVPTNAGRWAEGSDDCQKYTFGVLGSTSSWKGGWGCKGTSKTTEEIIERIQTGLDNDCAMSLDTRVNVFGEIDPDQFQQLLQLKIAIRDNGAAPEIESITLNQTQAVLEVVGDRTALKPNLQPLGTSAKDLKVTVKNPDVVEVKAGASGTFDVVAKQAGTTEIVLESVKDPDIRAVCRITVNGREPEQIIDDVDTSVIRYENGTWGSGANRGADQDGYYEYQRTVHYASVADTTASFTFTGTGFDYMTSYNTDQGKVSIQIDDGEPVTVDLSVPGGAVKKSYYMNAYGVYNLPKGEHTVVLKNLDAGTYFIVDAIRIYDEELHPVPVTGVTMDKENAELKVGDTLTLTATVEPAGATNKNVNWSSNNTGVATVDENGLVTAVAAGTATITVTTVDGGKTATCTVTVKPASDPNPDPMPNPTPTPKPDTKPDTKPGNTAPFRDVRESDWYFDAVEYV
ncbi:MAG: LamG-like jellyroll fold domain-containing protein, partial [Faecousia sp.]